MTGYRSGEYILDDGEGRKELWEVSEKQLLGQHGTVWPADGRTPTCPSVPPGLQQPTKSAFTSVCVLSHVKGSRLMSRSNYPEWYALLCSLQFSVQARGSCQCNFNLCISRGQWWLFSSLLQWASTLLLCAFIDFLPTASVASLTDGEHVRARDIDIWEGNKEVRQKVELVPLVCKPCATSPLRGSLSDSIPTLDRRWEGTDLWSLAVVSLMTEKFTSESRQILCGCFVLQHNAGSMICCLKVVLRWEPIICADGSLS